MKQIGESWEAERKKAKLKWHWCRRDNGFSDMPLWKLVARRCNTSVVTVLAFVNRLEEIANANGNIEGRERGSLEGFDPEEFGLALDITTDEAARIYAMLEDPKVNWISQDHLVTFYDRNKDREEDAESVRDRKRRSRAYQRVREQLADLVRAGKATYEQRVAIEVTLKGISNASLMELQNELARAELSTDGLRSHRSQSDRVTVTTEQNADQDQKRLGAVDNTGDDASGESGGLAMELSGTGGADLEAASRWLQGDGLKMVVERVNIAMPLAVTYMERWRRQLQDDLELAGIIKSVAFFDFRGSRFHLFVSDQVSRKVAARGQAQLPLPPTQSIPGTKRGVA